MTFSSSILPNLSVFGSALLLLSCGGSDDDAAKAPVSPQLILVYAQAGLENPEPEVQLTGVLPASVSKSSLTNTIKSAFPYPVKITDQLKLAENVTPVPWIAPLENAIPELLSRSSTLTLQFDGPSLAVQGISSTEEDSAAIRSLTIGAFSTSIQHVSHRLRVEVVKGAPSAVTISIDDTGNITLHGILPDQKLKDAVTNAIEESVWVNNSIENGIVVRSYAAPPKWIEPLVAFISVYFNTPQSRQLYVGDDSVRLGGRARSDYEKRSIVFAAGRAFLAADLPVNDTLTVVELSPDQRQEVLARQSLADYVKSIHIYFKSGAHTIDNAEKPKLRLVVAKLSIIKTDEKLMVVGLADSKGDPEINESVKRDRCKSVYNALVEMGCERGRLVLGLDFDKTPDPNDSPDKQRRVEFRVVSESTEG
jgi:outer membrane protein OmpA-like peptidoglycan-associated protein